MFYEMRKQYINLDNIKVVDFSTNQPRVRYMGEDRWYPLPGNPEENEELRQVLESLIPRMFQIGNVPSLPLEMLEDIKAQVSATEMGLGEALEAKEETPEAKPAVKKTSKKGS